MSEEYEAQTSEELETQTIEPVAATMPEPIVATTHEPTAATIPEPTAATIPEPAAAVNPEPIAAISPEAPAAVLPSPVAAGLPTLAPEPFYQETIKNETKRRTDGKFKRAVAIATIVSLLGGGSLGLGIGIGIPIAKQYFLPRLMDDRAQANAFSFDNQATLTSAVDVFESERTGYAALVEIVEPSVVNIISSVPVSQGFGSFSIPQEGNVAASGILFTETDTKYYIVTNNHVVTSAQEVFVSINGHDGVPASPVGGDAQNDLAVISILKSDVVNAGIGNVVIATFGDSDQMHVGDSVLAIGNALGEGNTATNGILSAPARTIAIQGQTLTLFQTNAAINEGNSGGPLVNMRGEVIGINTAKLAAASVEGMGYAIPINVAKPIIEGLMQTRPMLGVEINDINPELAAHLNLPQAGALVVGLTPGAPAAEAGILPNDVITGINDEPVMSAEQLVAAVRRHKIGDTIQVKVVRVADGQTEFLTVSVKLVEFAANQF